MSKYVPAKSFTREAVAADRGEWLCDLGLAYEKAGDAFAVAGHVAAALEKYQAGLRIFERLAAKYPDNLSFAATLRRLRDKNTGAPNGIISREDGVEGHADGKAKTPNVVGTR